MELPGKQGPDLMGITAHIDDGYLFLLYSEKVKLGSDLILLENQSGARMRKEVIASSLKLLT